MLSQSVAISAPLLAGVDEASRAQALTCADHSLRARGMVGWDDRARRSIAPMIASILLDYAQPRYTLFVDTYLVSTRAMPFLYVFGEHATYEQCQPEPDVLQ